jgi:hypothetical protein
MMLNPAASPPGPDQTGMAGPHWVRAAHRQVHRGDQLPASDHHHHELTIDPELDPVLLAALPRTH